MDREAWRAAVHGFAKSDILSDMTEWQNWAEQERAKNLKSDASKTEVIFYVWRMELKQEKWKQTVANEKS